jgi:urease accessory protein UreE
MHADLVKYHSSRCARIRRICEDETTIRPEPSIRRTLFRLAWLLG